MSSFWVTGETGRRHTVEVPAEVKGRPADEIFAWLRDEVARREAGHPLPNVPGAQEVAR